MSNNNKTMGILSQNDRLISLYIHPEDRIAKQSISIAEASKAYKKVIDLSEVQLTETQWADLAELLKVEVDDLINFEHNLFKSQFKSKPEIEANELLKLLSQNQEILKHGIAVRGKQAIFITQINDLMRLQDNDSGDINIP